jgi:antitoxin component YwqK of YwqJK toxin-antitoxin module
MIEEGAVIIVNKCFGGPLESSYQEYDETLREGAEACDQTHERPAEYTGKWTTYWENGQKYSECSYVNGQLQGKSTQWNSRGQKLMECDYKDGQRHGALTKWNGEGEIIDVSEWENGTGTYRIYYASGVLSSEHQMRHGKPHGVTREWNGRGEMTCTEHYEDGKLIHREGTPRWHHQCAFQRWSAETQCFPT